MAQRNVSRRSFHTWKFPVESLGVEVKLGWFPMVEEDWAARAEVDAIEDDGLNWFCMNVEVESRDSNEEWLDKELDGLLECDIDKDDGGGVVEKSLSIHGRYA